MSGRSGDALREAYGSLSNAPAELIELTHPGYDRRGMKADGTGLIRDPRAGHEERTPSFNTWRGEQDGAAMFQRKGSGETWNALQWLEEYGSGGAGLTRGDAAALLISRAGLTRQDTEGKAAQLPSPRSRPPAPRPGEQLRKRQAAPEYDSDPRKVLRGWAPLEPGKEGGPAWAFLRSRGLLPALSAGLLEAYALPEGGKGPRCLPRGVLPSALALLIKGPGGVPLAVKFRNPGTKAELSAAEVRRYSYPKGHKGTPAHCPRPLPTPLPPAELWIEGENNGAAAALGLEALGNPPGIFVQGIAGAGCSPHVGHDLTGRRVYISADGDAEGEGARERWGLLAADLGAEVWQVPALDPADPMRDAAELLGAFSEDQGGAARLGELLRERLEQAVRWTPPEQDIGAQAVAGWGEGFKVWPYAIEGGQIGKLVKDQDRDAPEGAVKFRPLLAFTARIVAEQLRDAGDGERVPVFLIEGATPDGRPLGPLEVPAGKFGALGWPLEAWGTDGEVYPGTSVKAEAVAALLRLSKAAGIERRTVYTHTGWISHPEHGPVFLSAGACIGAAGAVSGVGVSLLGKLAAYHLPEPPTGDAEREAVRASLELLELGDAALMVPLLGMVYRAPLGAVRFSGWLEGKTGWGKSAAARILLTHYGAAWLEQFPPADMQSTDNALTLNTFLAKDVFFPADDFKPEGTRAEVDKAHGQLSKFLSAAGNGSGRDRMDFHNMKVRAGYFPRGLVLVTAESSPRKHSDVARTVALTVKTALVGPDAPPSWRDRFNRAERHAAAGLYASALSGFLQWIAARFPEVTGAALLSRVRESAERFPGSHGRTANNSAELLEGWRAFLTYARDCGAVSDAEGKRLGERVTATLRDTSAEQGEALGAADPARRFLFLLSGLLRSGAVYIRDAETGEVPGGEATPDNPHAPALGWRWRGTGTTETGEALGVWEPGRNAVPVGYLGEYGGRTLLLLEPGAYAEVGRAAEREGHALPTPKALWRQVADRFRESGGMVTEKDRATYPRKVYGCAPGERVSLYNFSWPLPEFSASSENNRDHRDAEGKKAFETALGYVPFLFLESGHLKNNRDISPKYPTDTAFSDVPMFSPSAEPVPSRAMVPEAAEVEVFEV